MGKVLPFVSKQKQAEYIVKELKKMFTQEELDAIGEDLDNSRSDEPYEIEGNEDES